jgi:hypothetical protein
MPDLAVTIQATGVLVAPGSSTSFTVEVTNLGTVVDRYRCEIVGMDPSWVTVTPASMELFPQAGDARPRADLPPTVGRFTVTLHPPRVAAAVAGPWPIGARVTSEHDPSSRRVEETIVAVLPFGALEADLHPSIAGGRLGAKAIIQITNKGNRPEAVTILGSDPADKLAFEFRPPTANLGPGDSLGVVARLSGGGLKLAGGTETRPFKLDIRASSADTEPRVLNGTFERRALVPSGVGAALAVVAALALGAAAVFGLTRPPAAQATPSPGATPLVLVVTASPPTAPPTEAPPSSAPPTEAPPTSAPPTEPPPTAPPVDPNTCISGYVWREAFVGDVVCVTPDERQRVFDDNAAAASRVDPGGAYGVNSCVSGYIWRVARESDLVCVLPEEHDRVVADNAAAPSRRVGP